MIDSNDRLTKLLDESQIPNYETKYPSLHTNFEYSDIIKTISEAWKRGVQSLDNRLKDLTQSVITQRLDYHFDLVENLKSTVSLLKVLKNSDDFEKYFLQALKNLIQSDEVRDAYLEKGDIYHTIYQEKILELYLTFIDDLNLNNLDMNVLQEIILLCLVNRRKDFDLIDKIVEKKPEVINFLNKDGKSLIYRVFELYPKETSLESAKFLLTKGAKVNIQGKNVVPLVVFLAKKSSDQELLTIKDYLKPKDLEALDEEGHTAYYYILRIKGSLSEQKKEQFASFCPNCGNLPTNIVNILSLKEQNAEEETNTLLSAFIEACKTEKNPQNQVALREATRLFLNRGNLYKTDENILSLIELLESLKEDPYFEIIACNVISNALNNESSHNAELIFDAVRGDFNSDKLLNQATVRLIYKVLKNESSQNRIADILLDLVPNLIRYSCNLNPYRSRKCSMFFGAVEEGNIFAVKHLLKKSSLVINEKGLIHAAVENKNIEILKLLIEQKIDVNEKDERGNTPLHYACERGDLPSVKCLLESPSIKLDVLNNLSLIPLQVAQKEKKYEIANFLFAMHGPEQFNNLYQEYKVLMHDFFGMDKSDFLKLAFYEYKRCQGAKQGYMFDIGVLTSLSHAYNNLFGDALGGEGISYIQKSPIDFLPTQTEILNIFREDERTKNFPFRQIWRYGIDFDKQIKGPFVFENEPGYIKSFLEGMHYALQTANQEKTPDWYIELHTKIIDHTSKFINENTKWDPAALALKRIPKGVRTKATGFSIRLMDRDKIGVEDLRHRYPDLWENGITFKSPDQLPGEMNERLIRIFEHYQSQYRLCRNRAEKLLLFLATVRELEIVHIFSDANGRSSNLALLSMVMGEKDLPAFILPDPNCFDGNGPESLCTRFLEGCLNFRKGGIGHSYQRSKDVKKLESLDLTGHDDLIALREELKPLVEDKSWSSFPMYEGG